MKPFTSLKSVVMAKYGCDTVAVRIIGLFGWFRLRTTRSFLDPLFAPLQDKKFHLPDRFESLLVDHIASVPPYEGLLEYLS
jgi:hypothetical protein